MEYVTKVEFESFFRSCHMGPSRTSNWFYLNYPKDRDIIYLYYYSIKKKWTIKPTFGFNRKKPKEVNRVLNNERYLKSISLFPE